MVAPTTHGLREYRAFLEAKALTAKPLGVSVSVGAVHPIAKPHQAAIARWMVEGGRRACFANFGLGKGIIQQEVVRLTLERVAGVGLIICPLGVHQEFLRDAQLLGNDLRFVRSTDEITGAGMYLTNYESVREGKIDMSKVTVVSLDEAAVLTAFGGSKTFREFMAKIAGDDRANGIKTEGVPYRFVATATPAPNEYIELLAYAAFLGVMDVGEAKTRFFKRNPEKADELTLYSHKESEFWLWVSTWAVFLTHPSDICRCECHDERNFSGSDSGGSPLGNGVQGHNGTVLGSAYATVAGQSSRRPTTSLPDASPPADASDLGTDGNARASTASGRASSADALGQIAGISPSMAGEASNSPTDGEVFSTSPRTWESHHQGQPSSDETTTGITSRATADGQAAKSRHEIHDERSVSRLEVEHNHSRRGPRSAESATGKSTADTKLGGQSRESSRTCCDSCRCDEGYVLPPITINWREIPDDTKELPVGRDGQSVMFAGSSLGVQEEAAARRRTMDARIEHVAAIVDESPEDHFLIWHDLEDERRLLESKVGAVAVYGSQDLDERVRRIMDFADGKIRLFAGKPVMLGSGVNLQRHCHRAIFCGVGYKFRDFVQAIHRVHRYLQAHPVVIDIVYASSQRPIKERLQEKWAAHDVMVAKMVEIIRQYGLNSVSVTEKLQRTIGVDRQEVRSDSFVAVNNDCVEETMAMEPDSVGLVVTSIPFGTQYEYTPSYNDFGHTDDDAHFFRQMEFLTPQLLRVLKPGRMLCVHVKDRIRPGGLDGWGFQSVGPFVARTIMHYADRGFAYMGQITVATDVVRENAQTYRLGWSMQCDDGSRMGVGLPEYVLLFRKPPSDPADGYSDERVTKSKAGYSRAQWQTDAHALWRSNGNRLLTPDDLVGLPADEIYRKFRAFNVASVYDYDRHVEIGEALDRAKRLPPSFGLIPVAADAVAHPNVWTDVMRARTLNGSQQAKGRETHLCPLQFDIVTRLINRYSNVGDVVLDPFAGLFTVPSEAVKMGRVGHGIELNPWYFEDGVSYCRAAERKAAMPSLFALDESESEPPAESIVEAAQLETV